MNSLQDACTIKSHLPDPFCCMVMLKGPHETLIHCILRKEINFAEQLLLSLHIWSEVDEIGSIQFHQTEPPTPFHLNQEERVELFDALEQLLQRTMLQGTRRCIQLFLLRYGSSTEFMSLWANFIEKIVEAHKIPVPLGEISLMLIEWGLVGEEYELH